MAEYALTWAINVERRNMELFAAQRRKEWSTGVGHRYQSMQGRTMACVSLCWCRYRTLVAVSSGITLCRGYVATVA